MGSWYTAGPWDVAMVLCNAAAVSVILSFVEAFINRVTHSNVFIVILFSTKTSGHTLCA